MIINRKTKTKRCPLSQLFIVITIKYKLYKKWFSSSGSVVWNYQMKIQFIGSCDDFDVVLFAEGTFAS